MRLKKTLFSTEAEFTVDELRHIYYAQPTTMRVGFLIWVKNTFGLDLHPRMDRDPKKGQHAIK